MQRNFIAVVKKPLGGGGGCGVDLKDEIQFHLEKTMIHLIENRIRLQFN